MGAPCSKRPRSVAIPESVPQILKVSATQSTSSGTGRSNIVRTYNADIEELYTLDKKGLGAGAFGTVSMGTHRQTGTRRAIKTVLKKPGSDMRFLRKEVEIMKLMDHPNIIALWDIIVDEDKKAVHLAMEMCLGGELFDKLAGLGKFSEGDAATVMKQVLAAAFYMHSKNVCHRDFKPENLLFATSAPIRENQLRIIDFGLATRCEAGQFLRTQVGTVYYVAPQVLAGRYNTKADIWSIGIIMYILLSGRPPFVGANEIETITQIRSGIWDFKGRSWGSVSKDAKNLIKSLITHSQIARYSAEEALAHRWIQDLAPQARDVELNTCVLERLRGFRAENKFKEAAMGIVVRQLEDPQIKVLKDTFAAMDKNGDGMLNLTELTEGLQQSGLDLKDLDIDALAADLDDDNSGSIDYTEFLVATVDRRSALTCDVLWTAFNVFDENRDGLISQHELKKVLASQDVSQAVSCKVLEAVMQEVDTNGDGVLDFQEFIAMMRQGHSTVYSDNGECLQSRKAAVQGRLSDQELDNISTTDARSTGDASDASSSSSSRFYGEKATGAKSREDAKQSREALYRDAGATEVVVDHVR